MVREAVGRAREMLAAGDQEHAHRILMLTLDAQRAATDDGEAIAIAEATGMLVRLEAPLEPRDVVQRLLARMDELTEGLDADAVREARAFAELEAIEWVHQHEPDDAVVLVDVMRAAESLVSRLDGNARPLGVRQARAEAMYTAAVLQERLGQAPRRVAVGLETLALTLTSESDERLRHLRVAALHQAARIRYDSGDDPESAVALMRRVVDEAASLPSARPLVHAASLRLVDHDIGLGVPGTTAIAHGLRVLGLPVEADFETVSEQARHLDRVLDRLPDSERDLVAARHTTTLVDRYATCPSAPAREAILWWVLTRTREPAATTPAEHRLLVHTDHAFASDTDAATAPARVRVAARVAETTSRFGDPESAVRLYEQLDERFRRHAHDARLVVPLALATVDRALRLCDIGRRADALRVLAEMPPRYAPAIDVPGIPAAIAQAMYWRGRFLREAGDLAASRRVVSECVEDAASVSDPDVRLWAANALFSVWQSPELGKDEIDHALERFAGLFADERDVRIRRLDARRRLLESTRAAERGDRQVAAALLQGLVTTYGNSDDPDLRDTVELAVENQKIIAISSPVDGGSTSAGGARYRELRERLLRADDAIDEGRRADAETLLRAVAADTGADSDPNVVMLGLAATDVLGGILLDAGRWEELVAVARSAALRRPGLDTRASRVQARGHLRLGIALGRLGDQRAAIAAYEALDRLADRSTDGDIVDAREVAAYNRAVLIDDLGDPIAAIAAYDHALAVHERSVDSPGRRLRRVKCLRNKALLLSGLGRLPEATGVHRLVLDIASAAPDTAVAERGRKSAFDLAAGYTQLGHHRAAADLYAWMRSAHHLDFSRPELACIKSAAGKAVRAARRAQQ
ncbi:hypothetical protein C8K36_10623 [Rhodococcus sp. OK519]|uniref:hypothetical protein n=1 Tax=Rhodococcus sp. OK519 TaxID=2135729 RepID=UPI000D4D2B92|nr:hypothetical protein C8K36_10623 [Rhodococcus sp. OK519]